MPPPLVAVGGNMFDDAVAALAPRGQLLIIGMMSQYADGWQPRQYAGIAEKLLWKSASLRGFFLLHHAAEWRRHLQKLAAMLQAGKLKVQVRGGGRGGGLFGCRGSGARAVVACCLGAAVVCFQGVLRACPLPGRCPCRWTPSSL